jgi:hypothetical protein
MWKNSEGSGTGWVIFVAQQRAVSRNYLFFNHLHAPLIVLKYSTFSFLVEKEVCCTNNRPNKLSGRTMA